MQYYQEQVALGSIIHLNLVSDASSTKINALYQQLWQTIFRFERSFSRFLVSSELSTFNRNAGIKQAVSVEFKNLLLAAKGLSLSTDGLYNPFILPVLQLSGYTHSMVKGCENDTQDDHSLKNVVDIKFLEIGDNWANIPYRTALDMGGCGKGYLADMLATSMLEDVQGYWLSLGGDIVYGGTNDQGLAWKIDIQKADKQHLISNIGWIETVSNQDRAVATSGIIARRGLKQGTNWHHIIDPRTLKPAKTDILLATINAKSALRADVLATCAVILGTGAAPSFLKQQGISNFLLQAYSKKKGHFLIHNGSDIHLDESIGYRLY